MKIKKIVERIRRDFTAIYECEHCGFEYEGDGYDDSNFHQSVIPKMKCPECGKMADANYQPLATKHADSAIL